MSSPNALVELESSKSFGGQQKVFRHDSVECNCSMKFAIYIPPAAIASDAKLPVLYILAGLTTDEQSPIGKSGFQRFASELNLVVVCPDTCPRGPDVPHEDHEMFSRQGASFYFDATTERYKKHYRMYSYITKELPELLENNFEFVDSSRKSIGGFSMGGHGALIIGLKNPGAYLSISAFAPLINPIRSNGGRKALQVYLGDDEEEWKKWDATELVANYEGPQPHLLIDQGSEDEFFKRDMHIRNFENAVRDKPNISGSLIVLLIATLITNIDSFCI